MVGDIMMDKLGFIAEVSSHNWDEMVDKYNLKYKDVFSKNTNIDAIIINKGLIIICLSDLNNNIFPAQIIESTKYSIL